MPAVTEYDKNGRPISNEPIAEFSAEELEIDNNEIENEPQENPREEDVNNKKPKISRDSKEIVEICAATVVAVNDKEVTVFNSALICNPAREDIANQLNPVLTNVFRDDSDIEYIHTVAQQVSLNGTDPFSSPGALQEMFKIAVEEGIVSIEDAPIFNGEIKTVIIGNKVYFKDSIETLDMDVVTLNVEQIEAILKAENPEKLKEILHEIEGPDKNGRSMVEEQSSPSIGNGNRSEGMDIGSR